MLKVLHSSLMKCSSIKSIQIIDMVEFMSKGPRCETLITTYRTVEFFGRLSSFINIIIGLYIHKSRT